jgi:hypothetical protein
LQERNRAFSKPVIKNTSESLQLKLLQSLNGSRVKIKAHKVKLCKLRLSVLAGESRSRVLEKQGYGCRIYQALSHPRPPRL